MMIIKDIISLAKYSELAGVAVKDDVEAIVAFINLGMLELYTRFPVKTGEYTIALVDEVRYYDMPGDFMYATCAFTKIIENSKEKIAPVSINDDNDEHSIHFNDWNTVHVPASAAILDITVRYVPKPENITTSQANDGISPLDLPDTLIDCLLSYLGYRAHLGIRSDSQAENNSHWLRFDRNCKKALESGVAFPVDSLRMGTRIVDRGFV